MRLYANKYPQQEIPAPSMYVEIVLRPSEEAAPILERATPVPRAPSFRATVTIVALAMIGLGTVLAFAYRALVWLFATFSGVRW
jgi:hypothetical protein